MFLRIPSPIPLPALAGLFLGLTTINTAAADAFSLDAVSLAEVLRHANALDRTVAGEWKRQKIKPADAVNDETFLRRIYLDITGAIPTLSQARAFLDSDDPGKRSHLIDDLLLSEGYVSHYFNHWADLLRVRDELNDDGTPGDNYIRWVKNALRENKPFDEFVYELLTARGLIAENGAAGYYLRETGDPLAVATSTARLFLGADITCAQCHNHPYDSKWKQANLYELAAFFAGVESRTEKPGKDFIRPLTLAAACAQKNLPLADKDAALSFLRYNTHGVEDDPSRTLQIPPDYQYRDRDPGDAIDPRTPFDGRTTKKRGYDRRVFFADWLTDRENPLFTRVIANRLWAEVMGTGILTPVNDSAYWDEEDRASQKLLDDAARLMAGLDYDMAQFLRVLFNTSLYQREAILVEPREVSGNYFPGIIRGRMTAEQLWDSLLTLALPDPDARPEPVFAQRYPSHADLKGRTADQIIEMAKAWTELRDTTSDLAESKTKVLMTQHPWLIDLLSNRLADTVDENLSIYLGYDPGLHRASNLPQPAGKKHFLHQFGQSDRETFAGATRHSTAPQVLRLFNGPMQELVTSEISAVNLEIRSTIPERDVGARADAIFFALLGRRPSPYERDLLKTEIRRAGPIPATANLLWAIINTPEFIFMK